MYSSMGQQDGTVEQLTGQPMWGGTDLDKEYGNCIDPTMLQELDELPRATSAPPHLQNRYGTASTEILDRSTNTRMQQSDNFADIRYDEDYEAFYKLHGDTEKLPLPVDGHTMYSDMQGYIPQYKESSYLTPGSFSRYNTSVSPYGLTQPGGPGAFSSQTSLGRAGLETVEEQPMGKNEDSVLDGFNQLHIGNEIQRPGSQPAPNLLQALAAEAGHYRSASALASFSLDGFSGIPPPPAPPGTNEMPPSVSSPGPNQSSTTTTGINPMLHPSQGSSEYLSQMQTSPGSMMAGSLEYQAAYQAALQTALMQSQNTSQMMLGSQIQPPNVQNNHPHGGNLQQQSNYNEQIHTQPNYSTGINTQLNYNTGINAPSSYNTGINAPSSYNSGMQTQSGFNGGGGGMHPHGMNNEMSSILAAKLQQQQQQQSSIHGYYPQSTHSTSGPGGGVGYQVNKDISYSKDDRITRGKRFGRRDRDRMSDPAYMSGTDTSYFDSQYMKFNSIEEVVGQVIQVAQDQNGCRFLQRKFDEGGAQSIAKVFTEIIANIVPLMKDPFGNYLIQKLLDRCSEPQRTEVVKAVAKGGELISIALSTHGTRAVQKLIETLTTEEQRQFAISALQPGVVDLIKDLNGNHVVQRCLQRLGPEDSQFIYDAAIGCCVEIASHRHGCCVLQRCIDFATPDQRHNLVMEISANALVLSQDAFGNYVVQYVLDLGQAEASESVMTVLTGHYSDLAIQKFSSNVVEKCLKLGGLDDARESIIKEIMHSPALPRLLQDPYGNYVVQSALSVTSGSLHQSLVECIRPYLPSLKGTPHGKRILQKVLSSLKDPF
eukprot:g571.t1